MKSAIRLAVLASLIVAVFFVGIWRVFPSMPVDLAVQIENVQLIFWPASILLMAATPGSSGEHIFLYGGTILLNVILYGLIGSALWLRRKREIWWPSLGLTVILCLIWLRVLTL